LEHLAMMERVLGEIPHRMIRRSKYDIFLFFQINMPIQQVFDSL